MWPRNLDNVAQDLDLPVDLALVHPVFHVSFLLMIQFQFCL